MTPNPGCDFYARLRVLIILLLVSARSLASDNKFVISGYLMKEGETDAPVELAVVGVFKTSDSSLVAGSVTDYKGFFSFSLQDSGNYYLRASCVGYEPRFVSHVTFVNHVAVLGKLTLKPSINLQEIEVVDERPAYQIEEDKRVYNVEKDPVSLSGSTADVLQNIPSVFVDLDGNIKLRGGNVRILINGKPSGMLGISRRDILNLLPANMIERIEVMTNPTSQYDASGESGIINIILKKPKHSGLNGYFTGSVGTGDKYNGSGTLSYRNGKVSLSLSDDFRSYRINGYVDRTRETTKLNTSYSQEQHSEWADHDINNTLRGRAEYDPDSNTVITASASYRKGTSTEAKDGAYQFYNEASVRTKYYDRLAPEDGGYHSLDATVGFNHKFARKGQELSADVNVSNSSESTTTNIRQTFFDPATLDPFTSPPNVDLIDDLAGQRRNLVQVDYSHPLDKQSKVESGFRRTYRYNDLDYRYSSYSWALGEYFLVPQFTNHFRQSEAVNAGYLTYRNRFNKFSYRAGVRVEQTVTLSTLDTVNVSGQLYSKDYDRNYLNFFPSAHVLKKMKNSRSLNLSYSRRINRPGVRELNPFYKFIDATTVRTGNPYLLPQFTNSIEFSFTKNWKNATLNSSLYYRHTINSTQRISQLDTSGVAITTYRNFNYDRDIGLEVYVTGQVAQQYRINLGTNIYNTVIDGTNVSDTLHSNSINWNVKLNNVFTFGKTWVFQLAANYLAPAVTPLYKTHENYYADCSIRRDLMGRKFTVSLRLNDMFYTRRQTSEQFNPVYQVYTTSRRESRILYFGVVYRPGFKKAKMEEREDDNSDTDGKDPDER